MPQPTRRVSWFVSGFVIALALGVVIGGVVIVAFPSITGKGSTKTAEFTTRFDNSKPPQEMNAPSNGVPIAPAAPVVHQPSPQAPALPLPRQLRHPLAARRRVRRSPPRPFAA